MNCFSLDNELNANILRRCLPINTKQHGFTLISCSTFSLLAIAVSMAGVFHSCDSPPTFSNRSNFLPRFYIYPPNLWSVCLALVCPWKQNSENRQVLANGKDVISSGIFVSVTSPSYSIPRSAAAAATFP